MRPAGRATAVLLGLVLAVPVVSVGDTALAAGRFSCPRPGTAVAAVSDLSLSPDTVRPSSRTVGVTVQLPAEATGASVALRDDEGEVAQAPALSGLGGRWTVAVDVPAETPRGVLGVEVRWRDGSGGIAVAAPCDLLAAGLPYQVFVDPVPPSAPTAVSTSAGDGAVTVSWVPGEDGYAPFSSWTVVADPGGQTSTVGGEARSVTVDGLRNGTAYTFSVVAANRAGPGPERVSAPVVPRRPVRLTAFQPLGGAIPYGRPVSATARLTALDGSAVAGRVVQLQARAEGTSSWAVVDTATTDADGRAPLSAVLARSSALRLAHPPEDLVAAPAPAGAVVVAQRVVLAASRTRVAVRQPVALRGSVAPARPGGLVTLQSLSGGRWTTVAAARAGSSSAFAFTWSPRSSGRTALRVVAPAVSGLRAGTSPAVAVTSVDTVRSLAQDVLGDRRITLARAHAGGTRDPATAYADLVELAAGRPARRSTYGGAPGGTTPVDIRVLRAMRLLSRSATFTVSEVAGGSHAGRSAHYRGMALDITVVNGRRVGRGSGHAVAVRACQAAGATAVWSPSYDPYGGHADHVHCDWMVR